MIEMFIIVTCLVVVVIIWIPRHHGWREGICNESYQSLNIQNVNISLKAIIIFFLPVWVELGEGEGSSGSSGEKKNEFSSNNNFKSNKN